MKISKATVTPRTHYRTSFDKGGREIRFADLTATLYPGVRVRMPDIVRAFNDPEACKLRKRTRAGLEAQTVAGGEVGQRVLADFNGGRVAFYPMIDVGDEVAQALPVTAKPEALDRFERLVTNGQKHKIRQGSRHDGQRCRPKPERPIFNAFDWTQTGVWEPEEWVERNN